MICALAVVSTVTSDLRVTSAALLCQRIDSVRSDPRKPLSAALVAQASAWMRGVAFFSRSSPSCVPLSSCISTPGALALAVTDAMAAGGPVKLIWFHGSALVILAIRSSFTG